MVNVTEPSGLAYDAIAEYSESIGAHYGVYSSDGYADIDELVEQLGGQIEVHDTLETLRVDRPGAFTIFVPLWSSTRRDRFTKAHELGHYFLHYLLPKRDAALSFSRGASNRAETEANVFAASLLMPKDAFTTAFASLRGDDWALAEKFGVSPRAALVRAQVLGLAPIDHTS